MSSRGRVVGNGDDRQRRRAGHLRGHLRPRTPTSGPSAAREARPGCARGRSARGPARARPAESGRAGPGRAPARPTPRRPPRRHRRGRGAAPPSTISAGPAASGAITGRPAAPASSSTIPNGSRGVQCSRAVHAGQGGAADRQPDRQRSPRRRGQAAAARPQLGPRVGGAGDRGADEPQTCSSGNSRLGPGRRPRARGRGASTAPVPQHEHDRRPGRRRPRSTRTRRGRRPGAITCRRPASRAVGVQVSSHRARRDAHRGGPGGRRAHAPGDQRAGEEVLVRDGQRRRTGQRERSQSGAHPPRHGERGSQLGVQPAQLDGVAGERRQRAHPVRQRGAQIERRAPAARAPDARPPAPAAQAGPAGQASTAPPPSRAHAVEQNALGPAEDTRIADVEDGRHVREGAVGQRRRGGSHGPGKRPADRRAHLD